MRLRPTFHETERERNQAARELLSRFADGTGASGSVCALGALSLVLLIACANVSNLLIRALPGTPAGICRTYGPTVRALRLVRQNAVRRIGAELLGCGAVCCSRSWRSSGSTSYPRERFRAPISSQVTGRSCWYSPSFPISPRSCRRCCLRCWWLVPTRRRRCRRLRAESVRAPSVEGSAEPWSPLKSHSATLLLVGTGLLFHNALELEQSRLGFETAHITTFTAMPADAAGFPAWLSRRTLQTRPHPSRRLRISPFSIKSARCRRADAALASAAAFRHGPEFELRHCRAGKRS